MEKQFHPKQGHNDFIVTSQMCWSHQNWSKCHNFWTECDLRMVDLLNLLISAVFWFLDFWWCHCHVTWRHNVLWRILCLKFFLPLISDLCPNFKWIWWFLSKIWKFHFLRFCKDTMWQFNISLQQTPINLYQIIEISS